MEDVCVDNLGNMSFMSGTSIPWQNCCLRELRRGTAGVHTRLIIPTSNRAPAYTSNALSYINYSSVQAKFVTFVTYREMTTKLLLSTHDTVQLRILGEQKLLLCQNQLKITSLE